MALHRSFSFLVVALLLPWCVVGQVASELRPQPDPNKPLATVEASCGECNFDLPGLGCDLAVRLPEGSFYVDGVDVKEFGHPHDANGFCLAVRRAMDLPHCGQSGMADGE